MTCRAGGATRWIVSNPKPTDVAIWAQLKIDLKNGQSLSQVAATQKVSEAEFRTKLIANLKPVLDKAVNDKKMSSAQEQTIVTRLQTGPLPLWNRPEKRKPNPAATPSSA